MKRLVTLLLFLAVCFGLAAPVAGAGFVDIPDEETRAAVALMQNMGIATGYGDGTFRPGGELTRAQFCKMVVTLSGMRDISAYEGFTVFPDVRAGHWAQGYVNAAVRALKILTGLPDGTFRPDDPVTFAQAVTALMRLLGYTDEDVGFNWPRGYMDTAAMIGLTKGIVANNGDVVTRGLGARLFYKALFTENKDGKKYSEIMGFKEQNVLVMQKEGLGPDGVTKGLVTVGGAGFYQYLMDMDIEEGTKGVLLADGDGYALNWTPDKQTKRDVTVREVGPMSVTGADGNKIDNIPTLATVYINGEQESWADCWIDIPVGYTLRFFFNSGGAIDYIFFNAPVGGGVVSIVLPELVSGRNPLPSLGIDADARVVKNDVAATWADLRANDVLVYNAASNTVNATDFRITSVYESALPHREAPDKVTTLGGRSFNVLPAARPKIAAAKIGDAMTFLFTSDGEVADVYAAGRTPTYQPGILTGENEISGYSSVTLYNGMIISGEVSSTDEYGNRIGVGTPVLACMREAGKLTLQTIPAKDSSELDMVNMKAGKADIAPYAVFYDLCGTGGRAAIVDRATLPDEVDAGSVLTVMFDSRGSANLIILRDVTGDAWTYGFTSVQKGRVEEQGDYVIALPNLVTLSNQYGQDVFEDSRNILYNSGNNIHGVAINTNGFVLQQKVCTRVHNVRRSDFSGDTVLMVSGLLLLIPSDLKVYVEATGLYTSVADARVYSNNFTIHLDKPAAEGGKIRFITAL